MSSTPQYLTDLVMIKNRAIDFLRGSSGLMALISNNPNIDVDSDDTEQWDDKIYDYDFASDTVISDEACVMVETVMYSKPTTTARVMRVMVRVVCSNNYMPVGSGFPGIRGNRRDNMVRFVGEALAEKDGFGVGCLKLLSVEPVNVTEGFTGTLMTFEVATLNELPNRV